MSNPDRLSAKEIAEQQELLAAYRRTLAHLVKQAAHYGGEVFAPPQTATGIAEARMQIERIKASLRAHGVGVEDELNDTELPRVESVEPQRVDSSPVDAQASQGFINQATGPISQNFGEQTNIDTGGGPAITGNAVQQSNIIAGGTFNAPVITQQTNYYQPAITSLDRQQQRNRRAMLEKVKTIWITGLLEHSLAEVVRIDLGLVDHPDAVDLPLNLQFQELHRQPRPIPPGTLIIEVFTQIGGSLLILGAPGAGKTTLLLELTRDLIARAEQDDGHPIPVVFNLSSWSGQSARIASWLVDELKARYDVPRHIGQIWVDMDQVLPLLDGLDEVAQEHRATCAAAINHFLEEHGLLPMIVCSRHSDYETLGTRLRLRGAVVVQPLVPEQIDAYLARLSSDLEGVRAAMQADMTLQELAQTPLMLHVIALAYHGMPSEALSVFDSLEHWRTQLFATYVDRMFRRRGIATYYPQMQTLRWLSWLARRMRQRGQTIFFIERMQPQWLPTSVQRRQYAVGVGLVVGLIMGLLVGVSWGLFLDLIVEDAEAWIFGPTDGLIAGLIFAWIFGLMVSKDATPVSVRHGPWYAIPTAIGIGILVGLVVGLVSGGGFQLSYGLVVYGLYGGLIGLAGSLLAGLVANPGKIESVETLRWSWSKAKMRLSHVLVVGVVVGLVAGLVQGLPNGLISGLANGLTLGLIALLTFGLGTGLTAGELDAKMKPNQGIWRSAGNMARIGGAMALIACLPAVLATTVVGGLGSGLADVRSWLMQGLGYGLTYGLVVGLIGGLLYGGLACVQHVVLRFILARNSSLPLRLVPFLDYCVDRIFLRRVGGGYIFVHRLLMEHFASPRDDESKVTR